MKQIILDCLAQRCASSRVQLAYVRVCYRPQVWQRLTIVSVKVLRRSVEGCKVSGQDIAAATVHHTVETQQPWRQNAWEAGYGQLCMRNRIGLPCPLQL